MSVKAPALKRIRTSGWGWFALAAIAIVWINGFVAQKQDFADDAFFSAVLGRENLWDFLAFRYQRWTGRVPIELAVVTLINHMPAWRILNALMLALLCSCIGRLGFGARLPWPAATAAAFAVFMLATPAVLDNGGWWVSGSFNYLWPAALGIFSLLPFLERRAWPRALRLAFALAGGLAVYNEQIALLQLLLLAPLAWRLRGERALDRIDVAHLAFLLANVAVMAAAPGSRNRYFAEQATWFANFSTLDLIEKANIGLGLAAQSVVHAHNLLAMLLVGVAAWFLPSRAVGAGTRAVLAGGLALVAGASLFAAVLPPDSPLLVPYITPGISGSNAAWPKVYLVMAMKTYAVACLVAAIALVFQESPRTSAFVAWTLLAALGTVAALGWSPTAFASGPRIQFVSMVVLAAIACRAIAMLEDTAGVRTRRAVLLIVGAIASLRVLHLALAAHG